MDELMDCLGSLVEQRIRTVRLGCGTAVPDCGWSVWCGLCHLVTVF